MSFEVSFSAQFALEYSRFPKYQQDKVDDFIDIFSIHGLGDFSKYPGKITYSWKGLSPTDPVCIYAKDNELWHYHIGIPTYTARPDIPYQTSDWVLHFQWPGKGTTIALVDLYSHYTSTGVFYLPPESALANKE